MVFSVLVEQELYGVSAPARSVPLALPARLPRQSLPCVVLVRAARAACEEGGLRGTA